MALIRCSSYFELWLILTFLIGNLFAMSGEWVTGNCRFSNLENCGYVQLKTHI